MLKWFKNTVLGNWKFFAGLIVPLAVLPIAFIEDYEMIEDRPSTKYKTLYVVVIMAIYWALEIIPLAVTALIPLVLFPMLGVQSAYVVSQNYTKESNMIFLSGLIIAIGIEYCGLHNRIALKVMNLVGPSPIQLLFGTMAITAFLAMWISATSCVAILVPVVVAIIDEIHDSPEILTNSEIRRLSSQGVTLNPEGPDNASVSGSGLNPSLSGSGLNLNRRNTVVFGNNAFVSPAPRASFLPYIEKLKSNAYPDHPGRHSFAGSKTDRRYSANPSENSQFNNNRRVSGTGSENRHYNHFYPHLNDLADKQSLSNSVTFNLTVEDVDAPEPNNQDNGSDKYAETIAKEEAAKQDKRDQIKKMFLFGMAYAANIGGTAVITGTSPNKIFKEVIKLQPGGLSQGGKYRDITFFTWMALNIPAMLVNIIIAWIYLSVAYYGLPKIQNWFCFRKCLKKKPQDAKEEVMSKWKTREVKFFLNREYLKLGRINQHEVSVALIFIFVVLLWIFRSPDIFSGWGDSLQESKAGDSTPAMLGVILLFLLPRSWKFLANRGTSENPAKFEALLDWKFVTSKFPWGYLLLLGSGFAIADASEYSGMSAWIGYELELLSGVPNFALLIVVVVLTSLLAEVVSNVACANIILPVVVSVSRSLQIHPLYLSIPVSLTCQYAFLFPIATPSNAIVFSAGSFSTMEMVKTGLFLNIICIVVVIVNTLTFGNYLFAYNDYEYSNSTESGGY